MKYDIVYYGNETLKSRAEEIKDIDDSIIQLVNDMFETMYESGGIGLAAPQIDIGRRLIVIDCQDKKIKPLSLINPVVFESSETDVPYEEGCLSLPGIAADVMRPSEIMVKGVNLDGKEVEIEAKGILARVLQHEIDHINGIVFIDRLEDYVRNEFRKELKKIKKMNKSS